MCVLRTAEFPTGFWHSALAVDCQVDKKLGQSPGYLDKNHKDRILHFYIFSDTYVTQYWKTSLIAANLKIELLT